MVDEERISFNIGNVEPIVVAGLIEDRGTVVRVRWTL
jgi:hypothetical protein